MNQDILLAAARVQCAVEGHQWGELKEEGFPYVAYFVSVCNRCREELREKAPTYTERLSPIERTDGGWE